MATRRYATCNGDKMTTSNAKSRKSGLALLLCAALVAIGVYFLKERGFIQPGDITVPLSFAPKGWKPIVVKTDTGGFVPAPKDIYRLVRYGCGNSAQCIQMVKTIFENYDPTLEAGVIVCPEDQSSCVYTEPTLSFQVQEVEHRLTEAEPAVSQAEKLLNDYNETMASDHNPTSEDIGFHTINTDHTSVSVDDGKIYVTYRDSQRPKLDGKGYMYVLIQKGPQSPDWVFQCVDNGLPNFITPDSCETQDAYNEQVQFLQEAQNIAIEEEREKKAEQEAIRQAELESNPSYQLLQLFGAVATLRVQQAQQEQQQARAASASSR